MPTLALDATSLAPDGFNTQAAPRNRLSRAGCLSRPVEPFTTLNVFQSSVLVVSYLILTLKRSSSAPLDNSTDCFATAPPSSFEQAILDLITVEVVYPIPEVQSKISSRDP